MPKVARGTFPLNDENCLFSIWFLALKCLWDPKKGKSFFVFQKLAYAHKLKKIIGFLLHNQKKWIPIFNNKRYIFLVCLHLHTFLLKPLKKSTLNRLNDWREVWSHSNCKKLSKALQSKIHFFQGWHTERANT